MVSSKNSIIDFSKLSNKKVACLTLDIEQDYGDLLENPSYEGLEHVPELVKILKEKNIPLTCFVQGSLLESHSTQIESFFALDVEFELHSYSHPGSKSINTRFEIEKGREAYRRFFGENPLGYRSPLGIINDQDYEILTANGFKFDSSVFPSLRPGVFNNLRKPTKPYHINGLGITEFPFTVFSDVIRIPIALSYLKLIGKPYIYLLKAFSLPSLIIFCFHLHDLFELSSSNKIPLKEYPLIYRKIFRKIYQERKSGLLILEEFIKILQKKEYMFLKLIDVYKMMPKERLK